VTVSSQAAQLASASTTNQVGSVAILYMFNEPDGTIFFAASPTPPATCNWWARQFIFDATTTVGKMMYATLLAAKLSGTQIHLWYQASSAPGTDQSNGCTPSTIAVATGIGLD
jgi:hypothetical protein